MAAPAEAGDKQHHKDSKNGLNTHNQGLLNRGSRQDPQRVFWLHPAGFLVTCSGFFGYLSAILSLQHVEAQRLGPGLILLYNIIYCL